MNITDALTLVREAALEGRSLEAWCDGYSGQFLRYNKNSKQWHIFNAKGFWQYGFHETEGQLTVRQVLGTWHVREVEKLKWIELYKDSTWCLHYGEQAVGYVDSLMDDIFWGSVPGIPRTYGPFGTLEEAKRAVEGKVKDGG